MRRAALALSVAAALGGASSAHADGAAALRAIAANDCKTAVEAANDGISHEEALAYLAAGVLFDDSACVTQNYARAAGYFQKAIEGGNREARNSLGLMYGLGHGSAQDYGLAYRWFTYAMPGDRPAVVRDTETQRAEGYMRTVTQLARARVRYPPGMRDQGIVVTRLHSKTGEVIFLSPSDGTQLPAQTSGPFVRAIAAGFEEALREAPPLDPTIRDVVFELPWKFELKY